MKFPQHTSMCELIKFLEENLNEKDCYVHFEYKYPCCFDLPYLAASGTVPEIIVRFKSQVSKFSDNFEIKIKRLKLSGKDVKLTPIPFCNIM